MKSKCINIWLVFWGVFFLLGLAGCGTANANTANANTANANTANSGNANSAEAQQNTDTKHAKFLKNELTPHEYTKIPNRCIRYGDQVYIDPDLQFCFGYPIGFSLQESPIQKGMKDTDVLIQSKDSFPILTEQTQDRYYLNLRVSFIDNSNKSTLPDVIDAYVESKGKAPSTFYQKLVDTAHNDCTKSPRMSKAYMLVGIDMNISHDIFIMQNDLATKIVHVTINPTDNRAQFTKEMEMLYTGVLESFSFLTIDCGEK